MRCVCVSVCVRVSVFVLDIVGCFYASRNGRMRDAEEPSDFDFLQSYGIESTRVQSSSSEAKLTRDILQRNRDKLELQSSLNLAKRTLRGVARSETSQRPHPQQPATASRGQPTRSPSSFTLRSVGKFSTQLDPSHVSSAQLRHLREQQPDSLFTRRAAAYRGLPPSASTGSLPHPENGIVLSSKRPLPQFQAARPKQKAALEIMNSIPFSEQLADRLKEVNGTPPQFLSLVKRGEWFYHKR